MNPANIASSPRTASIPKDDMISPFFMTLLIVMTLFFVDEGYYDFRWMADPGNWIVFGIYMAGLYPIQFLISRFLFVNERGFKRSILLMGCAIVFTISMIALFAIL